MKSAQESAIPAALPITYVNEYYVPKGVEYREVAAGTSPSLAMKPLYSTSRVHTFETFCAAVVNHAGSDREHHHHQVKAPKGASVVQANYSRCSSYDSSKATSLDYSAARRRLENEKMSVLHRASKDLQRIEQEYELLKGEQKEIVVKSSPPPPKKKTKSRSKSETTRPANEIVIADKGLQEALETQTDDVASGYVKTSRYYFHQFPELSTKRTNPFSPTRGKMPQLTGVNLEEYHYFPDTSMGITGLSAYPVQPPQRNNYRARSKTVKKPMESSKSSVLSSVAPVISDSHNKVTEVDLNSRNTTVVSDVSSLPIAGAPAPRSVSSYRYTSNISPIVPTTTATVLNPTTYSIPHTTSTAPQPIATHSSNFQTTGQPTVYTSYTRSMPTSGVYRNTVGPSRYDVTWNSSPLVQGTNIAPMNSSFMPTQGYLVKDRDALPSLASQSLRRSMSTSSADDVSVSVPVTRRCCC